MKTFTVPIVLALIALPLAGCINEEESQEERTRGVVVSIPEDVHTLEVDVTASAEDQARIQVEVEEADGTDITEENFEVAGGAVTRTITVDVGERDTVGILVTVAEGDAMVSLTVRGIRAEGEPVVIRHETFVIVLSQPTPAATPPADGSPTPTTTTTPPAEPTPPATNDTGDTNETPDVNETPDTNETGGTNETNETP